VLTYVIKHKEKKILNSNTQKSLVFTSCYKVENILSTLLSNCVTI